uniref:Uncharacterized protein At4g06744 family n=1 Tax=Cajanus cajan TaxID=3821 RepID=A0A151RJ38_CAJCA|nr:Uncharacterized protein At4g06744 family [Cajanus cajan]
MKRQSCGYDNANKHFALARIVEIIQINLIYQIGYECVSTKKKLTQSNRAPNPDLLAYQGMVIAVSTTRENMLGTARSQPSRTARSASRTTRSPIQNGPSSHQNGLICFYNFGHTHYSRTARFKIETARSGPRIGPKAHKKWAVTISLIILCVYNGPLLTLKLKFHESDDFELMENNVDCQILETPSPPSDSLPLIPDILNFLDQRVVQVIPIIQTFKNTITLDPLGVTTTWVGPNVCNYTGFYCGNPPDNLTATTVSSIDFNGFQITAPTLDGFIDQLPDLALFHANTNNFSGTISPKIANLKFLYELDLSNNFFSGVFPTSILKIPTLSFLDIRYNFFSGTVPPQIFMQTLDVLFINNNNFMLTLPNNLGDTPVVYLTLANNKFTGPIPRSIGKASSTLVEVLLLNNLLTGCLPYEIGFLGNVTLFDAGGNLLTGPIPWSFGCLKKVEQLNLARNFLYGQVPEVDLVDPVCGQGRDTRVQSDHDRDDSLLIMPNFTPLVPDITHVDNSILIMLGST